MQKRRGKYVDGVKNVFDVILTGRMNLENCWAVKQLQGSYFCLRDKRWFNWPKKKKKSRAGVVIK